MSLYDFLDIIYYVFISTILFPLVVGIFKYRRQQEAMLWLLYFLLFWAALEIIAIVLRFNHVRNHFLYYFHTITTLALIFGSFSRNFDKKLRIMLVLVILVLLPVEVTRIGFNHINSVTLSMSRLALSIFAFLALRNLIISEPPGQLAVSPYFFIYLGLLVIGFFSLLTSLFKSTFIETSLNLYYFFDTLSVMTNAIGFIILARGFWLTDVNAPQQIDSRS